MYEKLDESNFLIYAAKYYDNPQCFDTQEFMEDLNRFRYVKRLLKRYKETGDLKERLILNHIIIIYNVFGPVPATRMLFFKMNNMYTELTPFLEFLGYLPDKIDNIGLVPKIVYTKDIEPDKYILDCLKNI